MHVPEHTKNYAHDKKIHPLLYALLDQTRVYTCFVILTMWVYPLAYKAFFTAYNFVLYLVSFINWVYGVRIGTYTHRPHGI